MHSKVAYTLKRGRRSEKWHGNGEKRNFRFSGNSNPLPPKFSKRHCRFCGFASAENTTVCCVWTFSSLDTVQRVLVSKIFTRLANTKCHEESEEKGGLYRKEIVIEDCAMKFVVLLDI